ncbi:homoserine kinase-like [Magnolia sinica]|uniref:homoserine kinase-like n=1 Tax=Magnolia sinica TaxID=86752 RepID=UPI0026593D99|nr:homoserine kinase-like [Magnolia sinica]
MAPLLRLPLQHHSILPHTRFPTIFPNLNFKRSILSHPRSLTIRCNHTPSRKTVRISDPSPIYTSVNSFAPASIANLGPGFDLLGCAIDGIGDTVTIRIDPAVLPGSISISSISGYDSDKLSFDPLSNCAGIAATATMRMLDIRSVGLSLSLNKGVPLGIGLGSSAASAAAAVVAVNELFNAPLLKKDLVFVGYESELKVSGVPADHIAAAIMGGFAFIINYDPLYVFNPPFPAAAKLYFVLAIPEFESPTKRMRAQLYKEFRCDGAKMYYQPLSGLVTAVDQGDVPLLGDWLSSKWYVESSMIPGVVGVQSAALEAGAFGFTISGAGPTVVAVTDDEDKGKEIGARMVDAFWEKGKLKASATVHRVDQVGARIIF